MRRGIYQPSSQTSQRLVMSTVCSGKEADPRYGPINIWNLMYVRDSITLGKIDSQYGKI